MKESVGNDQFSVKLLETHNIFTGKTPELSAMRVQSEPLFGGEAAMILMVVLAGLMGLLAGALDKEDLNGLDERSVGYGLELGTPVCRF